MQILPNAKSQFIDSAGQPLASGTVGFYYPGTLNPKATYQDAAGAITNTNPVQLDSRGQALIWGTGVYRQIVKDASGVTIWDQVTEDANAGLTGNITDAKFVSGTDFTPGTTTQLTLPVAPATTANMWVFFDGTFQADDQYTVSGTALTFNNPIPVGTQEVNAKMGTTVAIGTPGVGTVVDASVAAGSALNNRIAAIVNVKDTGATGNGTTDDTTAIQAALNRAGANGVVYFPAGTYLLSATLSAFTNQQIIGAGAGATLLTRAGDYGDTLHFANAGAARIEGIWFEHSTWYSAGLTALPNLAAKGAHIYMIGGQSAKVVGCRMWRLRYGVVLDGCALTNLDDVWTQGVWDPLYAACQEGQAGVLLSNATGNCEIIKITRCYINGAKASARNVTYTATDGTQTVSRTQNIGPMYGILVYGCEDLLVANNFIGAQYSGGLYANLAAGTTNLDWRIIGNFFDDGPSVGSSIYFNAQVASLFVNGVTITGNVFNGETQGINGIIAFNGGAAGQPTIANFTISANTFQGHVGAPIALYVGANGQVSGNTVTAYNSVNTSPGNDPTFCAGIALLNSSEDILVYGNIVGGQLNNGLPGGYSYQGVSNTGTNAGTNTIKDNMCVGIGLSVNQTGLSDSVPTQLTTAGNYQATSGDQVVCARASQTAAWTFGLPLNPPPGRKVTFKDAAGTAATYNVQVIGTVDGVTNPVYSTNFFTKTFYWNGVQWNVVAN